MSGDASLMAIGVDVGGTHVRAALVDGTGHIHGVARHTLQGRDPQSLLDMIAQACHELGSEAAGLPIGLGLAAQIWLATGVVAVAPNLGWTDVPFGAMLHQRFKRSVRMVNDLNAIAVGEAHRGAGAGSQHVVCVFVGTGVGMGAVVAGHVVEGADGLATELGHIKVASVEDGRLCGCGERGCLEAYTSGRHLPDLLAAKVASGVPSALFNRVAGRVSEITAGLIESSAVNDRACAALWEDVSVHLACAIGNAVTLFNPQVLVLGGGVFTSAPGLKKRVLAKLPRYAALSAQKNLRVRDTGLGDDAGIIGAALLAPA